MAEYLRRVAASLHAGLLHHVRRRPEGSSRDDRDDLSSHSDAPSAQEPAVRALEGVQAGGATGLQAIYAAPSEEAALSALETFEATWSKKYSAIRKAVYTTNAVESLNYSLHRIVKDKGTFPNNKAIFKLLWLVLWEASKK